MAKNARVYSHDGEPGRRLDAPGPDAPARGAVNREGEHHAQCVVLAWSLLTASTGHLPIRRREPTPDVITIGGGNLASGGANRYDRVTSR